MEGEPHWCEVAQQYKDKCIALQKDLDEYTEESVQVEKELEMSLDEKEKALTDLRSRNRRLETENESLKKKIDQVQQENVQFENQVKMLLADKEKQVTYIRELEQKNDDLERAQRVISESVAGVETLLNQAYERNAVLESEVDEMENLRVKLQRLSDEARDLKQELRVKEVVPNGNNVSAISNGDLDSNKKLHNGHNGFESNRHHMETETQTNPVTPLKCDLSMNGNTMSPSSRISALNIVGDLLRKVGGLESKLASCRAPIHSRDASHTSAVEYSRDPYRMRRISSRGPSSPAITPNFIH